MLTTFVPKILLYRPLIRPYAYLPNEFPAHSSDTKSLVEISLQGNRGICQSSVPLMLLIAPCTLLPDTASVIQSVSSVGLRLPWSLAVGWALYSSHWFLISVILHPLIIISEVPITHNHQGVLSDNHQGVTLSDNHQRVRPLISIRGWLTLWSLSVSVVLTDLYQRLNKLGYFMFKYMSKTIGLKIRPNNLLFNIQIA